MSLAPDHEEPARSNQNHVLRACREQAGWSLNRAAIELQRIGLEAGIPVPTDVQNVRRMIQRHERGVSAPRHRDEPYAQLYALGYGVEPEELFGNLRPGVSSDGTFVVHAHQFVPLFVGADVALLAHSLKAADCVVGWSTTKRADVVLESEDEAPVRGVLYLFSWGVGVLHVVTPHRLNSIAELALWRRTTHRTLRRLLQQRLGNILGRGDLSARYVLTAFWLVTSAWEEHDLQTAMHLFTAPRALLGTGDEDLGHARQIEKRLFKEGFSPVEHVAFGVDGVSIGWASWAGVAYHPLARRAALIEDDLVITELLAQAVWCLCDDLDQQVRAGEDPALPDGHDWRWLRGRRAEIARGDANEPTQLRRLRAAIVATSELDNKLTETVQLLREEAP
jgi:hypothetical protein